MRVSIIGAGNVSWFYAYQLNQHAVHLEIHYRNTLDPKWDQINHAKFTTSQKVNPESQYVILAVSDQAVGDVLKTFDIPTNSILLHVSGSIPMDLLSRYQNERYGVLYPLQSLSIGRQPQTVPLMIEGNNQATENKIQLLAEKISTQVSSLDSLRRAEIHRSAVFASNFVNHMLTLSNELLKHSKDFDLLQPLVQETIDKAFAIGPKSSQTGPAIRGDQSTIEAHLQALDNDKLKKIYKTLSMHITETHSK